MTESLPNVISKIFSVFDKKGDESYADEPVTQLEHALQTANLATENNAPETVICAALLHDLGHILAGDQLPASVGENLHDQHEEKGYQFLKSHFGKAVAEPVRLHVAAKRYLCSTDSTYEVALSPTSLKSYYDQGGRMSDHEVDDFEKNPYFKDAVQLRRWDDLAKEANKKVPLLQEYLPVLKKCILHDNETSYG
jgi:phosphonate degradation associated HDIG domain protein